ncbi:MAG: hypothetical protein KDJ26_03705 [Alphaproteobacteria bacterium]|jgi:hypothetical protein|nr:hypothetical protein [Alphaproteobacteria bacterium]MCB9985074.1 hypothetical protein [Micavibrio sp.]
MASLRDVFHKSVGMGQAFLVGSLLTVCSGYNLDNSHLVAGGMGLAIGAILVNREKYKAVPYALLPANAVLAFNGLALAVVGEPVAGVLLASANSFGGYGTANWQMLKSRISPQGHGVASAMAGLQIAAAGAVLYDPMLVGIGALFAADGVERAFDGDQSPRQVIQGALKSLTFGVCGS